MVFSPYSRHCLRLKNSHKLRIRKKNLAKHINDGTTVALVDLALMFKPRLESRSGFANEGQLVWMYLQRVVTTAERVAYVVSDLLNSELPVF